MNHFDDEAKIMGFLQFTDFRKIKFVNLTVRSLMFFASLYIRNIFKYWTNNSAKDVPPPDFVSDKYKYMLEVMRVDDFAMGNNSPNALESKFNKKLDDMLREQGMSSAKEQNIEMFIIPDMSKASENNYRIYVENFKRVVNKHVKKIEKYRTNHPGYKLGFLIFDEAPCYFQGIKSYKNMKLGDRFEGFPHFVYKDVNLVESFIQSDLDFVIWMTPNKDLLRNPRIYPKIMVFDLKGNKRWKKRLKKYPYERMVCLEMRARVKSK